MNEMIASREQVQLGRSGVKVTPVAWGMWRFAGHPVQHARALVDTALSVGITLFDTADIYGLGKGGFGSAESLLGEILAEAPGLRDQIVLATKGGIMPPAPYNSSADYLAQAIDASLARLRVDWVDLYQIHRPDMLAHPQEVARALEDAVRAGKVRAIGVSNYTPAQARALASFLTVPLVSHQPEFSPLHIDPMISGLFDQAMQDAMAVLAWSPLGGGRLIDPQEDRARNVTAVLSEVASESGVDLAAAAYSWVMLHPARPIPIIGTQNPARIEQVDQIWKVRWTRQRWYDVVRAVTGGPLP